MVGVILNLAIWFALHVFFKQVTLIEAGPLKLWTPALASLDWRVWTISAISGVLLLKRDWSIPPVLAVAAALALALKLSGMTPSPQLIQGKEKQTRRRTQTMHMPTRSHSLLCPVLLASIATAQQPALDAAAIEKAWGLKGTFSKDENVFKVSKPRGEVKVKVDSWTMPPFMGLTSSAAFTPAHDGQAMLMGDTVLFEDEVNPALRASPDSGLEVTALHNHFFFDEPKVYFMYIGGMGEAAALASG